MILETSKEAKESIESIEYLKDKLDSSAKIIEEKFSKFSRDLINETNKTIWEEFYKCTYLTAKKVFNLKEFPSWEDKPEVYHILWPVVVIGYPSDGPLKVLERTIQEWLYSLDLNDYSSFKEELQKDTKNIHLKDAFITYASMYSMYRLFISNEYLEKDSSTLLKVYLEYPRKFLEIYKESNYQLNEVIKKLTNTQERILEDIARDILFKFSFHRLFVTREILEGKYEDYDYVWKNLQESIYRNAIINKNKLSGALEDGELWRGLLIDPL